MGFSIKFNWVLQIEAPDSLKVSNEYSFTKEGNRFFPIKTPIDLICLNRTALAKIQIIEFTNTETITDGVFKVLKIYEGIEKEVLSRYWNENQATHFK
jgi:hypothetical protein